MRTTALLLEVRPGASGMLPTYLQSLVDQIDLLAIACGLEAGEQAIRQHRPDVVFVSGELVERRINLGGAIPVVLTGQWWSQDKLEATGAKAQLLIPTSLDEIGGLLESFEAQRKKLSKVEAGAFHVLPNYWEHVQAQTVSIPVVKGFRLVRLNEVAYVNTAGSYADVYLTHGRKFQASRSIKYLAAQMEPFGFFRCHDSFVVNLQEIEQYTRGRGGTLRMRQGEDIPVSRYRKELLMELLRQPVGVTSSASTPIVN